MKTLDSHFTKQRSNTGFACVALSVFVLGFSVLFSAMAKADDPANPNAADARQAAKTASPTPD